MSSALLFACGAAVFGITIVATFLYGYHVVRRQYALSVAVKGVAPALYVTPPPSGEVATLIVP
jgi:hypothetical protein